MGNTRPLPPPDPGTASPRRPRPRRPRPAARPGRARRWGKRGAITVTVLIVIGALAFGGAWLITPSASQATALARAQAAEHGIAYPGPALPAAFTRPLIATEDHRFYSEPGVDFLAVGRVAWAKLSGGTDQGGATLEQQLAKLLYTPDETGPLAEFKQVMLAFKLNVAYSKAEILRLYAEVAYYGHGFYGLQQASCGYFGHPAADLTVVQGAMLAGVVNAPSVDDPILNPGPARARLEHVIARMVAVGYLTGSEAARTLGASLGLASSESAGCSRNTNLR